MCLGGLLMNFLGMGKKNDGATDMIELNKETNTLLTSIRGCQVLTYSDDVLKQQVIRYRKNQRWSGGVMLT